MANTTSNIILNNKHKFTDFGQGLLITKLAERFSTKEKQYFAKTFLLYTSYKQNEYLIDLNVAQEWLKFSRKDAAKRLLVNRLTLNEHYTIITNSHNNSRGHGLNKEQILLTVRGFKNFCLLADTPVSKEIQNYYMDLEEIIQEIVLEEKILAEQKLEDSKKELVLLQNQLAIKDEQSQRELAVQKHKLLLKNHLGKRVVYIAMFDKTYKGKKIIKPGFSFNLENRPTGLAYDFGPFLFCAMYECYGSEKLEADLHRYFRYMNFNLIPDYKDYINGNSSQEHYAVDDSQYQMFENFILAKLQEYNLTQLQATIDLSWIQLKREENQLRREEKQLEHEEKQKIETRNTIESMMEYFKLTGIALKEIPKVDKVSEIDIQEVDITKADKVPDVKKGKIEPLAEIIPPKAPDSPTKNKTRCYRIVQQYDPIIFDLIKTYRSLSEVIAALSTKDKKLNEDAIKRAAHGNRVYAGFRWLDLPKNASTEKHDLEPTASEDNIGKDRLITKVVGMVKNPDTGKTSGGIILDVFNSRKAASEKNNITKEFINRAILQGTTCNGYDNSVPPKSIMYQWYYYDDKRITEEHKTAFVKAGGIVPGFTRYSGKAILRTYLNGKTERYNSVEEAKNATGLGTKSINRICKPGSTEMYKTSSLTFIT